MFFHLFFAMFMGLMSPSGNIKPNKQAVTLNATIPLPTGGGGESGNNPPR